MNLKRYWSRVKIKQFFNKSDEWTRVFIKGLEESGRYPPETVIRDGIRNVLVIEWAIADWAKYRKQIERGIVVPPYKERRQL